MSENMIERVALAIAATEGDDGDSEVWHDFARAAIAAMREPLLDATMTVYSCTCGHLARAQVIALIDAALVDGTATEPKTGTD